MVLVDRNQQKNTCGPWHNGVFNSLSLKYTYIEIITNCQEVCYKGFRSIENGVTVQGWEPGGSTSWRIQCLRRSFRDENFL